jgi:hypothetical protein
MRKRIVITAASAIAILSVGIGGGAALGASSSIPDSSGTIHGCYRSMTGALRVIDTGAGGSCLGDETSVKWSQTGPAGPSTAGSSGLDTTTVSNSGTEGLGRSDVYCPSDHPYVLGGGGYPLNSGVVDTNASLVLDAPDYNTSPQGWAVEVNVSTDHVRAYAICSK